MESYILQYQDYVHYTLNQSVFYAKKVQAEKLRRYLNENGIYKREDVELQNIFDYFTYVQNTPIRTNNNLGKLIKESTVVNIISYTRLFFRYLATIGMKLRFNREQIPARKAEISKRDYMRKEEYEILRQAPIMYEQDEITAMRNQLIIDIPRETGLRRAEILRCKFEDFHNPTRQFKIEGKCGSYETVFFSEKLRDEVLAYEKALFDRYKRKFKYIIFGLYNRIGGAMTPEYLGGIVREYVKKLKADGLLERDITLHQERHSFAMNCVFSGLSQQATTQLMRHKDPKITLIYYSLDDKRLLNQYDSIKN